MNYSDNGPRCYNELVVYVDFTMSTGLGVAFSIALGTALALSTALSGIALSKSLVLVHMSQDLRMNNNNNVIILTSGVLEHKWRASLKLHYC